MTARPATAFVLTVLWAGLSGFVARADEPGLFTSLYGDRRASQPGDTLHLVITENSKATTAAEQKTQQSTKSDITGGTGRLSFLDALGFGGSSSSSASGSATRGGTMSARMTVQVVEVTEGGNLLVEGLRSVTVNRDKEVIRIRGEVRKKDVRPDNTIYSYDLANVQIDFVGSDPRKPGKKVGIITRILNLFF
jgi:flagellar L-ring protein FlgH